MTMEPSSQTSKSQLKRGSKRSRTTSERPHDSARPSKSKKPATLSSKQEPRLVSSKEDLKQSRGKERQKTKQEPILTKNEPEPIVSDPSLTQVANGGNQDDGANDGQGYRWWDGENKDESNPAIKWTTLSHNAVIFPPLYEPHGLPIIYGGKPIQLQPKAEEIATFYAAKLDTEHVKSDTFNNNFFEDFRASLEGTPEYKIIKELIKCDFSRIYSHLELKKAEKKELSAAERKKLREEEAERCKKYTVALVDGREEKVGNFRVEPPGLFLGRGEHPKRGKVKARIYPEDITINIGAKDVVPPCPMEGHKWGSIVHKQDVTWLCGWKDTITGGSKYVWLAAGSAFKGMSDHAKFEKARKLKNYIDEIRRDYQEGLRSKVKEVRQRSTAMYLIDKLALRVGNEKQDEEADTVGCCSLRVEHVKFEPPSTVVFDFLGKDSIRYFNSVEVQKLVFDNLKLFCRGKQPSEEIFHRLTVTSLNDHLKSLMDGLSAKVFRTYNASITLDELLGNTPPDADLNTKIVFYNQQNKEVAILCNHQKALPKQHGVQMEKLESRISEAQQWLEELQRGLRQLKGVKDPNAAVELTQWVHEKPVLREDMDDKAKAEERKRAADAPLQAVVRTKKKGHIESNIKQVTERIAKLQADLRIKDDLKTVALGTSKINYLDPRITIAWCKKHNVPIERIFAKTLLVKFAWAMEASETFRF